MTNFDYLKKEKKFRAFADAAVIAERSFQLDSATCVLTVRRAAEFAVKWMYTVDNDLTMPYQDSFVSLINTTEFKDIIGTDMYRRLEFIRVSGNNAAHSGKVIKPEQAELALENLFYFLDLVAYFYADDYQAQSWDASLLRQHTETEKPSVPTIDVQALIAENAALKAQMTAQREKKEQTYNPKPLDISEYKTRQIYIDTMLIDAGWTLGKDWINEYELEGMPNKSGVGYADYVLFSDDGSPLAVIEAKRTCKDVAVGRQQAKLYADLFEQKFGRRPIIFLTNGFDTRIWNDKYYPERKVSGIYSKHDLEKEFNKLTMRIPLGNARVNDSISGRYYQKEAIKAICRAFDTENLRKALLVMATGSGKTRTVISIVDVLLRHGWVKNILFLADRNSLVTQAKRAFVNLLPNLSVVNLCEDKANYNARGVFSTYQTMINMIDTAKDENNQRFYTVGHFDLIICDEAHRSIYNKYKDIFTYFDAHLVGLTATPKDEIDKNTYGIFELESGVPTYGYDLAQAVQDGYLVDFLSVETKLKLIENGIVYDELSEEDKEAYEELFIDENGEIPDRMDSSLLNEKIFNRDTTVEVLHTLMEKGIKIDFGSKLGKTIIFAKNHKHAEHIYKVFGEEYPYLQKNGFCRVIDNYTNYAQSLIDEFSDAKKMPQIVVSVDMMDTGIDVPEVVNLVFYKKVMSKAKFWQMIGRGTRLCPGLLDGEDKKLFYIFDFCGNFEFFRLSGKGRDVASTNSVQERIFYLKAQMIYKMQDEPFQTDEMQTFREQLISDTLDKVNELNRDNFAVKVHLKYVDLYSDKSSFVTLSPMELQQLKEEVAPLIQPYEDEVNAVRFDALMYAIELGLVSRQKYSRGYRELVSKLRAVTKASSIPEVKEQLDFIRQITDTKYLESAGLADLEEIRTKLRDLIKYIPYDEEKEWHTNFDDEIVNAETNESNLENDDLQNYRMKVNFYIRQHMDTEVIKKLHTNQPLTHEDISALEKILWSELGTKEDYQKEYSDKPLGELVREIVGLDMNAAKEAFAVYLNDVQLDDRQIYFVNQIINYIIQNGVMKDFSVMQEAPFTDKGELGDVFEDVTVWLGIMKTIKAINANALAA